MKAVILAAGEGKRIRPLTEEKPKGLVRLLGLSLVERVVLTFKEAGIRDFIVVVGYQGEKLRRHLGDGSAYGVRIEYAANEEWEKGNGTSLYAARSFLLEEERFLVAMSDHVYDPSLVKEFLHRPEQTDSSFICVDEKIGNISDLRDATKVLISSQDELQAIGKGLDHYNALDCGLFLFRPHIFAALEEVMAEGRNSLTDAAATLAAGYQIRPFRIGEHFWEDVDNLRDLRVARRKILNSLKGSHDGIISRSINRRLSIRITSRIIETGITPNKISIASFNVCILATLLFFFRLPLLAGLAAQMSSILDGVDGEISRGKFKGTPFGGYFDSILDRYGDALIILGMAFYSYSQRPTAAVLAIAALALVGAPLSMITKEKFHTTFHRPYIPTSYDGWSRFLPSNRDGRMFVVMLGGVTGYVLAALLALAVLSHFQAIYRLIIIKRIYQT